MEPYNLIKDAIITGRFEPGKRLTEEALAEEYHVSRTPIREAIKKLENDGLVTPLKRGVIVRTFTKDDIRQIYDLRALLESYVASEAAFYRSDEDLWKMKESNSLYKKAIDQYTEADISSIKKIVQANKQFHQAILSAAKNEHLGFHLAKVVVVPLVFRSFYSYHDRQLYRSYEVHNTIMEAIRNQEFERAKSAMQEHVYGARDHVLTFLENNSMEK
ncbi:GntR family transcriptional regulator [Siminovitchia sp. FSL H7-0308]|uniref:DNA-binding GntR family transcriptional regulator n=1 Tax=Siminovitchia thermophila TaxID=1245522 RepID=A0ABS2RDD6_9BACI|nr:GntR family transcriptional regulator [Siminovitchia thermophila]MBM7716863.1 DNA-binding GntR family transcriptional regulator [Siminovitchia thermophila]ONK22066.1 transcriptional regulator [Bacillus sp. VT-16-64]